MRKFHAVTIKEKTQETPDSIALTLSVPDELADDYRYEQGQHLPVRAMLDGKSVRRTYSICSSVNDELLRIGVRVQEGGQFSNYIADELNVGDTIEAMPPYGHFNTQVAADQSKVYVAYVAGSGITPILSIAKTVLESEPESQFIIFICKLHLIVRICTINWIT